MNMDDVRRIITEQRRSGLTLEFIGAGFGISAAMVKHIETHPDYHPTAKMCKSLGIDPTRKQIADRERRAKKVTELQAARAEIERLKDGLQGLSDFVSDGVDYGDQRAIMQQIASLLEGGPK